LYKKQQAEAAKVARQHAAEERCNAKKARADELAAARALKKQQRDAATAQKSHDTPTGRKRKASLPTAATSAPVRLRINTLHLSFNHSSPCLINSKKTDV
jgi:hypothetical protein